MPVTFDIYPEFIEAKLHRVDTIDRVYEENSWKKSGQEIRHCNVIKENKFFSELESTICKLNGAGEREEYHKSLEELITAYGTRRIHTKDSTAWINFRGCYYKNNGYHYCV